MTLIRMENSDGLAYITMSRPKKRNALSRELALQPKTTEELGRDFTAGSSQRGAARPAGEWAGCSRASGAGILGHTT